MGTNDEALIVGNQHICLIGIPDKMETALHDGPVILDIMVRGTPFKIALFRGKDRDALLTLALEKGVNIDLDSLGVPSH